MTPTLKTARRSLFAAFAVCAAAAPPIAALTVPSLLGNRGAGSVRGQPGRADRRLGRHLDR